jgi:glycosyltransferase involved in cell wall biosynthesis
MKFFIVTPTYNSLTWLPECIASVAGQAVDGIEVHHHVQDGGSTDGTAEFLEKVQANSCVPTAYSYSFSFSSEKDEGMYDAINRGWDRAADDVDWLGHLNADEQYQPGMLARIAQAGTTHPEWGAITGNCIWVDERGEYLCSRKPSIAWPWVGRIWIPAFTCAFFIRRRFYGDVGVRFDTSWKSLGDKVFCRDLLDAGCRFGYIDEYMATFLHRGEENLGFSPITDVEKARYRQECLSPLQRRLEPLAILAGKASRAWRTRLGKRCKAYTWIDESGQTSTIEVKDHRWKI